MPLSDVLNNTHSQAPSSSAVPAKRPLDDASQVEQSGASAKRAKTLDQPDQPPTSSLSHAPAPSSLLPPPCNTYIQLRFQLHRFKGVYRIARLPLTFTFKHLYAYLLFLFGWSGYHAHTFAVLSHVELYARTNRPGEIKKSRSYRIPQEPDRDEDMWAWQEWATHYRRAQEDPVLRVSERGRTYEDGWLGEPGDGSDPFDRVLAKLKVPCKKPGDLTLGDIWSVDRKRNLSKGKCSNRELAIKFEYDLSSPWEVDITIDPDKKGHYLWQMSAPRNHPELFTAKGAPPLEDAVSYDKDIDGKKKTVSPLLFERIAFERYLKGEICSVVCNTEQAVYDTDHPPASVLEENDEESDEAEEDGLE